MLLLLIPMGITGCEFFLTASFLVLLPGNLQGRRGASINRCNVKIAAKSIRYKRQTLFLNISNLSPLQKVQYPPTPYEGELATH